jgi:hypothetical protein
MFTMPDQSHHCPFLNRADRRCSDHFSLDHLEHAFEFCFDSYASCPVYLQLLLERQVKRVSAAIHVAGQQVSVGAGGAGAGGAGEGGAGAGAARGMKIGGDHAERKLVQISLPRRYAQSAA